MVKKLFLFIFLYAVCCWPTPAQTQPASLIQKGWAELVKDNDTVAIHYFEDAYQLAKKEGDTENTAAALLHLGFCYYGVSQASGLDYCFRAMEEYKKLEATNPEAAVKGRSRCLQLLSTIYSRQGKYAEVIGTSTQALAGFPVNDSTGSRGLMFTSLAKAYQQTGKNDSSEYFYRKALQEQLEVGNLAYLPSAYINVAALELEKKNRSGSELFYRQALHIADNTGNLQAQVTALLGMGKWHAALGANDSVVLYYQRAKSIAAGLRDKTFYLSALKTFTAFLQQQGNYKEALLYKEEINKVQDSLYSYDQMKLVQNLEVRFNLAEKDRKVELLQKERDISRLTNYLLWAGIVFILLLAASAVIFLRKVNARNKLLLETRQALSVAQEEQNKLREQYLKNELEFKESQLSAMAIQMMQKNNLLQELKEKLEQHGKPSEDQELKKVINKGMNQDKEWDDFNAYFESINKNFYAKLKDAYPDISQNDLKICALIKLNMSIKEMAGILNISPDSVKTARYRLRKKLQLNTEDNLAEFIIKLS